MTIKIDATDRVPIFLQIFQGIISSIVRGDLRFGEALPSVRQLAKELLVNPNTVAKAYRDLTRDGFAESKRGVGLFVAEGAEKKARVENARYLRERLEAVIKQCAGAGMNAEELEDAVRRIYRSLPEVEGKGR